MGAWQSSACCIWAAPAWPAVSARWDTAPPAGSGYRAPQHRTAHPHTFTGGIFCPPTATFCSRLHHPPGAPGVLSRHSNITNPRAIPAPALCGRWNLLMGRAAAQPKRCCKRRCCFPLGVKSLQGGSPSPPRLPKPHFTAARPGLSCYPP